MVSASGPAEPIEAASGGAAATRALGAALAPLLEGGDVVLLVGELGTGKTTLVQGLVAALGGTDDVTSPTFTLAQHYATTPPVTHVDLWRLDHLHEVVDLALDEVLDEGGVVVAEWGEAAEPLFGGDALVVQLERAERDDARRVTWSPRGASWAARGVRLAAAVAAAGAGTS